VKKSGFRVTVFVMSFALAGLIMLQAYWIFHDFKLKEQQFDQSVMLAMNEIVAKVEQQENIKIVVQNFISQSDSSGAGISEDDSLLNHLGNILGNNQVNINAANNDFSIIAQEIRKKVNEIKSNRKTNKDFNNNFLNDSSIDIRIENDIQQKEVISFNLSDESLIMDSIEREAERRMESKFNKLNSLMNKLTFQINDRNKSLLERIPPKVLDSIIYKEFIARSIPADYIYGIKQISKKNYEYASSNADTNQLLKSNYSVSLFPNDILKKNEQLTISFPRKYEFLFYSLWPLLISAVVFSIIMVIGFIYVMRTVLTQKKLAEIKSDFINNMTHEFKTPIATISIANESLKNPKVYSSPEKLDYYTGVIRDENKRMLRQVEVMLQMAQLEKGELKLKHELLKMEEVVEEAINSSLLSVENKNGKIELNVIEEIAPIAGDRNHLINVISNLIDNSIKYSNEAPQIVVSIKNNLDNITIAVKDNGIGMTKEVQKRIFDTFYRATTGNLHDVKGFGLGLSYVRAIVEQHQGTISVESEINKGSTFTIQLPINKTIA
jgi:two-component system phosphate regulon sensor histidine kinase PhoR